jgi:Transposase DDE domain group 1
VKYSRRRRLPIITADGGGIVNHTGALLLKELADRMGLTDDLARALTQVRVRRSAYDPAAILRDIAVMLATGGDCIADLAALRGQATLFGEVAPDVTAWRAVRNTAPKCLAGIKAARATARARAWAVGAAPRGEMVLDFDATLIESHSDKEGARGTWKRTFGFHPLLCYLDDTSEPLAGIFRPGNASSDSAADHIAVLDEALAQIPSPYRESRPMLARADSAGGSHDFVDALRERGIRFTVGFQMGETVREAIVRTPESAWTPALDQEGEEREGAEVCELNSLELSGWPEGTRAICRRERAHPGAQLKFWEDRGIRHQVFITDQTDQDIAILEMRHRQRAHVEDRIRCGKATGLEAFPSHYWEFNEVWLELILIAQTLIAWIQLLCLTGDARLWEPKRLRYRLFHTAAQVVRTGRRVRLRLQRSWPWSWELSRAFARLRLLPAAP